MKLDDEHAIRSTVREWERAWNSGDMASAAALFCDDADFVNVRGSHWHGGAQIESKHAELHELQLKGSVFAPVHVGVQQIGHDTALVHLHWSLRGDHDLDGSPRPPREGVFSWLMLRAGPAHWRIRSAHNTNITGAR